MTTHTQRISIVLLAFFITLPLVFDAIASPTSSPVKPYLNLDWLLPQEPIGPTFLVPPSISSISPTTTQQSITDQNVRVNGSNFVSGLVVLVTFPSGGTGTLQGSQIVNVTSSSFTMRITLNATGTWRIQVRNPNGELSNQFSFNVASAQTPNISSLNPSSPTASNSDQNVSVSGSNFQDGMTVTVFFPGGGTGTLSGSQLINITPSSFTMRITLNLGGTYGIRVNNPSGLNSNTFNFNVRPRITSTSPTTPCVRDTNQNVVVNGAGFQANLTVTVTFPTGGSTTLQGSQIQNISPASFTMAITLGDPGTYTLRVNNPSPATQSSSFNLPTQNCITVTATSPSSPIQTNSDQPVIVQGTGFASGLTVVGTTPSGTPFTLSGSQIQSVTSTSFTLIITLNAAGNWTFRVRNPNGDLSNTRTLQVQPPPTPDFTIFASPSSKSVTRGETASYSVTVQSLNGFNSPVNLTALNLPGNQVLPGTGFSPNSTTPPTNGSAGSTLTIVTNNQTLTGVFTITIRGTSGNLIRETAVSLTVNQLGDFGVSASPTSRTVTHGNTASYTLAIQSTGGFNSPVTLTALNLPGNQVLPGTGFNPQSVTPAPNGSATSTLTIVTNNQTPTGSFNITVRGTSGNVFRETTINLTVNQGGDFTIAASPTSRTILRGNTASFGVSLSSSGSLGATVSLFAINLPNNQVLQGTGFAPQQVNLAPNGSGSSTLTIATNNQTPTGTFVITIRGVAGSITRETQISLTVNASYPAPVISSPISPSTVTYNQATTLTVNGSGFRPNFRAFVITPDGQFEIASAGLTFVSVNQVRVQVLMLGSPPYTSTLRIVNDDGQAVTATFQVQGIGLPAPSITNITPDPVTVNQVTTLTVTGNNFVNKPDVKVSVPNIGTWDIAPSGVIFESNTRLRVQVQMGGTPPYQATLKVINNDQQSATRTFSVSGAAPTVELWGLEVTQGIQDLANSIKLIKDKRTFVRAFVKSNVVDVQNVRAELVGRRNGVELPESPLPPVNVRSSSLSTGTINVVTNSKRQNLNNNFLFELPRSWTDGTIEIEFRGVSFNPLCREDNGTDGNCQHQVTFSPVPALDVNLIGIVWHENGIQYKPDDRDYRKVAEQIEALFPIPRLNRNKSADLDLGFTSMPDNLWDFGRILGNLSDARIWDGCMPFLCDRIDLGILKPGPNTPGVSGMGILNVGAGYIDDQLTVPHEFGHLHGRKHVNPSPLGDCTAAWSPDSNYRPVDGTISSDKSDRGFFGFDVFNSDKANPIGAPRAVYDYNTKDLMTYCEEPPWISPYTYIEILKSIENQAFAASEFKTRLEKGIIQPFVAENQSVFLISGYVDTNNNGGTINSVYKLASPATALQPQLGTYAISFENQLGQVIASYDFSVDEYSDSSSGSFALLLPWDARVSVIRLVHNDQVLTSRNASANAPTIKVLSPNGGEMLGGASATVNWTASDIDGDSLKYVIQFSGDNGVTWKTLATDWTATSYTIQLNSIPGTAQGRIRVLASDGFHTADDRSDAAFSIGTHGPRAGIATPTDNSTFVGDQQISLQGDAVDIEDGVLSGSALTWSSSLDGSLGTGTALTVNASSLTEGIHTITLSAKDSEGQIGSSSINVQVLRSRPVIPATLSVAPSSVSLTGGLSNSQSTSQIVAVRNEGDGVINWSATANQSWIQLSAPSGTAPSNLTVSANPSWLAVGTHTGTLTISTSDAANSPQTIEVTLQVVELATVEISGRVFGRDNRGQHLALVSVTDSQGNVTYSKTNSFGYYLFPNVLRGETVTILVSAKGVLVYQPLTVQANDNLTNVDISPDP